MRPTKQEIQKTRVKIKERAKKPFRAAQLEGENATLRNQVETYKRKWRTSQKDMKNMSNDIDNLMADKYSTFKIEYNEMLDKYKAIWKENQKLYDIMGKITSLAIDNNFDFQMWWQSIAEVKKQDEIDEVEPKQE